MYIVYMHFIHVQTRYWQLGTKAYYLAKIACMQYSFILLRWIVFTLAFSGWEGSVSITIGYIYNIYSILHYSNSCSLCSPIQIESILHYFVLSCCSFSHKYVFSLLDSLRIKNMIVTKSKVSSAICGNCPTFHYGLEECLKCWYSCWHLFKDQNYCSFYKTMQMFFV